MGGSRWRPVQLHQVDLKFNKVYNADRQFAITSSRWSTKSPAGTLARSARSGRNSTSTRNSGAPQCGSGGAGRLSAGSFSARGRRTSRLQCPSNLPLKRGRLLAAYPLVDFASRSHLLLPLQAGQSHMDIWSPCRDLCWPALKYRTGSRNRIENIAESKGEPRSRARTREAETAPRRRFFPMRFPYPSGGVRGGTAAAML